MNNETATHQPANAHDPMSDGDPRESRLRRHDAADICNPIEEARRGVCEALLVSEGRDDEVLGTRTARKRVIRKALLDALEAMQQAQNKADRLVRESPQNDS
jgi:hypothetical protein